MPRRIRIEIPGVPQHVVQRGNNRMRTFEDDEDRQRFLKMALEASLARNVQVHAYVLMGNHTHMLVGSELPRAIPAFMHDLGSRYAGWFNARHGRTGTLWEGRYKSALVDTHSYLWNCHRYVEFNPVRAGISRSAGDYPWSSFAANAWAKHDPLVSLRPEYLALGASAVARCRAYREFVAKAADADEFTLDRLRNAVFLGSETFDADVKARTGLSLNTSIRGRPSKARLMAGSRQPELAW